MSSSRSLDTRFKRTEIEKFPTTSLTKTEDNKYWSQLQPAVNIQEFGPVSYINICAEAPYYTAISASTKVQIINPASVDVYKVLTKFRDAAYGARFRRDGQLLAVGNADGQVRLFGVNNKTLLRTFSGHSNATHRALFLFDQKHVASFSDDKTVSGKQENFHFRIWDVSTESEVHKLTGHSDYVRSGCCSLSSSAFVASGSYDHTVKLWDLRQTDSPSVVINHGNPVEDILLMPNGTLLISAGGPEIKVWDLLNGGRLLTTLWSHNKAVTSLGLASGGTRLVSSSLDRQIKFHNLTTFKTVHSLPCPSPVLTVAVSPDDSFVAAGMSDGLVQFMHRKVVTPIEEREEQKLRRLPSHRYLQFTHFNPLPGDVIIKQEKNVTGPKHDQFLQKFEYTKALDQVLKPYVVSRYPECTYSVLKELKRRNGLITALGGRSEKSLNVILKYLLKNVIDPRFTQFLLEIVDLVMDLYSTSLGNCPSTDKLFVEMRKRIAAEERNMTQLLSLQGSLDVILSGATASEKPELRIEEKNFRKNFLKTKSDDLELNKDKVALSWEKTLLT